MNFCKEVKKIFSKRKVVNFEQLTTFIYSVGYLQIGAEGRTRTGTLLPTADFESAASANSATSALLYNSSITD